MYTLLHVGSKLPESAGNVVHVCVCVCACVRVRACVRVLLLYHLLNNAVHKMLVMIFRLRGQVSKCTLLRRRLPRMQRPEGNE